MSRGGGVDEDDGGCRPQGFAVNVRGCTDPALCLGLCLRSGPGQVMG